MQFTVASVSLIMSYFLELDSVSTNDVFDFEQKFIENRI